MDAAVRNQEDASLACGVRELAKIWQKSFRTGHIEFAPRLHEVFLRVHFPKDDVL